MENNTIDQCLICNHKLIADLTIKDPLYSKQFFKLFLCNNCHTKFTNPRPNQKDVQKYYQSDNYISHNSKKTSFINLVYKLIRNYMLQQKYKKLFPYIHNKKILDYGCGNGSFVNYLTKMKENIVGYDNNQEAKKNSDSTIKSLIYNKEENIQDIYNIITLWHVIEHIENPNYFINKLDKYLYPKGYIIIAIPNHLSYESQKYKENWAGYDVPRHYSHFSNKGLNLLLEKYNYTLIKKFPLIFDAYYISLMSEINQKNNLSWLNAIKMGYLSNEKGKKTGEYSSNTYIYQKKIE